MGRGTVVLWFKVEPELSGPAAQNGVVLSVLRYEGSLFLPFSRFYLTKRDNYKDVAEGFQTALILLVPIKRDTERMWQELRPWLASSGYQTVELAQVKSTDPPLIRAIMEYVAPGSNPVVTVAGVSVPLFYLPLVLSAFILMSTTLLIGTWAATNDAVYDPPNEGYGWVMLYVGRGFPGRLTLFSSHLLFLLVIGVPLAAMAVTAGHLLPKGSFDRISKFGIFYLFRSIIDIDFPTLCLFLSFLIFIVALSCNFVDQLRLRTAMALTTRRRRLPRKGR
jgi:hypothetical protein